MRSILIIAFIASFLAVNASGNFTMIEINPQHGTELNYFSDSSKHIYGAGELSNMTELNGNLYFVAQDTVGNEELWTSDGTQQGTYLVKDINPNGSSQIGNIVVVDGKLLFMATDNGFDFDLFSSDGTSSGTVKVSETNELLNDGLSTQRAAVFGNKLLFCTSSALISTDGTIGGTNTVLSISQYAASPAQGYCELNGYAYFMLADSLGQPQLWRTDGTTQGTEPSLSLSADSFHVSGVERLFAFNNKLYMVGYLTNGSDLFSLEGNVNGHLKRIQLNSNSHIGSNPHNIAIANNLLIFVASTGSGNALFKMSDADTVPQVISSVAGMSVQSGLSFCNNSVYFMSDEWHRIHRIGLDDLMHHTIDITGYTMPSYALGDGSFLVGSGGKIFFAAYDTATNKQYLLESNGTGEGVVPVMPAGANTPHPFNAILSCGSIDAFDLKMWGNKVVVPANFTDAGRELWLYAPDGLTGIEPMAEDKKNDVRLFPNPASQQLNVQLDNGNYCETTMRVTTTNGQLVETKLIRGNSASVNVASMPAGNYFATFTTSGQKTPATKTFVVTK